MTVELVQSAVAGSTARTYSAGVNKFLVFCEQAGAPRTLPPSDAVVAGFIAFMCLDRAGRRGDGLAASTIRTYLYALRHACVITGVEAAFLKSPRVELVWRAAKKRQAHPVVRRLPITAPMLVEALRELPPGYAAAVLWFAFTLAYAVLLRLGEVAPSDDGAVPTVEWWVRRDADHFEYRLPRSKTDPFRQGVIIDVFRVGGPLCPVSALERMLLMRPAAWGPRSAGSPLFDLGPGRGHLRKALAVDALKVAMSRANARLRWGLDMARLGGHCLRRGAACHLHAMGVSDVSIQAAGRWRSWCFRLYVEQPAALRRAVMETATRFSGLAASPVAGASWELRSD